MLPGDELVADYLARAGRSAAALLSPLDCASVVEEVGRRVRAEVGAPPRWDLHGTEAKLAGLGPAEDLVLAVTNEIAPHALPEPEPEPEPEPQPEPAPVTVYGTDLTPESLENPTLDLGAVQRPVLPAQSQARVSETAGGPPPPRF